MCNNIPMNQLNKKKKEAVVKDKISDWIENRPKLSRNVRAIKNKIVKGNSIEYVKGSPLKLHDGTRIYKISEKVIREGFKEIIIEFSFKGINSRKITTFKRYRNDDRRIKDGRNNTKYTFYKYMVGNSSTTDFNGSRYSNRASNSMEKWRFQKLNNENRLVKEIWRACIHFSRNINKICTRNRANIVFYSRIYMFNGII